MPDLCYKRPFYFDVIERTPFFFTTESTRIPVQIELLLIFLKSCGQLCTPDGYWTQVGDLNGHSAATADFTWSPSDISVSMTWFDVVFQREEKTNVIREGEGVNKGQPN